jgi:hypothetical protein
MTATVDLSAVVGVIENARATAGRLVTQSNGTAIDLTALPRVFAEIDTATAALRDVALQVPQVWGRLELTPEARQSQADTLIDAAQASVDAHLAGAQQVVESLQATLERLALPARPEPADAAQTAELSAMKDDLRMLLDASAADRISDTMCDQLERYIAAGNALGVWLLGADDWPDMYYRSRNAPNEATKYAGFVPGLLAQGGDPDGALARRVLDAVTGPSGLVHALTAARYVAQKRLEELRQLRRSSL